MNTIQQWTKWLTQGNASIPQVLLENYKELRLNETEMMLLIHIHSFVSTGNSFPSVEQLWERMTCSNLEVTQLLNRLLKEGYLDIHSSNDEQGLYIESYSLEPLWGKLFQLIGEKSFHQELQVAQAATVDEFASWPTTSKDSSIEELEGEIFRRFEQEFGRSLSPMEVETISLWLDDDQYTPQLIFMALREAVISNKLSLRYIDRILFEWQKLGLKTEEAVREHSKKFRQQQVQKGKLEKGQPVKFTFYNWLEK